MQKTLCDIPIGDSAIITAILAAPLLKQRFLEMGLLVGTTVKVIKYAPLGDPIQIMFKGYTLCIRKEDAKLILVSQNQKTH